MRMALGIALDRTIAPVIGRDGLLGCLSLIGPVGTWASDDALLASRGAAACAIVLAREFASIAARREIELNVLDEVLDGALRNEATLLQQARRLGQDLESPQRLVVIDLGAVDPEPIRSQIAAAVAKVDQHLLWRIRVGSLEVVLPAEVDPEGAVAAIVKHLGLTTVAAGAGAAHTGLSGLQRSRNEAQQALTIQRRLSISPMVARYADLGIFRLLFAAESLAEFDQFHDETLGVLDQYDVEHRSDLVDTLRAFFSANGSPKDAAQRLGVHRNTVLYRLERIGNLTGYDLSDADTRLRLQLALSINTIKGSAAGKRSAPLTA
jgi:DNA-binding PucR family transcriptional regulator